MFDAACSRMDAALMGALGRPDVTIRGAGYEITLQGIFSAPWVGTAIGGMQIDRPDPTLEILTADLAELGGVDPQPGDKVEIGGRIYTIVTPPKDMEGITELVLRAYV
ncbi:MAG: head-tail joining protein [Pseudomonadota bacterium]